MSNKIESAKAEFYKIDNCSCVILDENNKIKYTSLDKGIKPLIDSISVMKNSVVADKIIGKAAALICVYGGVKAVYGHVMSESAKEVFDNHNIERECLITSKQIENRLATDICPMEKLVMQINDPAYAYKIISEKIAR